MRVSVWRTSAPEAPEAASADVAGSPLHGHGLQATPSGPTTTASQVEEPSFTGDELPIEPLGRYVLQRELARGGQGIVYLAYDSHLKRQIAFKVLRLPRGQDPRSLSPGEARFVREARITAQLEHPGIAPIYEVGRQPSGALYVTQKLVHGRTLAAALAECRGIEDRFRFLQAFASICQAVAYAHERGVIHRDLKPGNAMLGELGEVVVVDWGLARTAGIAETAEATKPSADSLLTMDSGRTREGSLMGTPAYMSPEQAAGAHARVDARSDVWSLGVILYELLTGRRPFEGTTSAEVLHAIANARFLSPRTACPGVPPELAAVCERALMREPSQRYASAKELAAEVSAWLGGGRVSAHEYSSWQLVKKFVERNRAATVTSLIVLIVVAVAGANWRARNAETRHGLADSLLAQARDAARKLRWAEAALYYAASRVSEDRPAARLGLALAEQLAPLPISRIHVPEEVKSIAFLADGRPVLAVIADGRAEVRDARTGDVITRVERAEVRDAALSADGRLLLTSSAALTSPGEELIETWSLPSGQSGGVSLRKPARSRFLSSFDGHLLALSAEGAPFGPPGPLSVHRLVDGVTMSMAGPMITAAGARIFLESRIAFTRDDKALFFLSGPFASATVVRADLASGALSAVPGSYDAVAIASSPASGSVYIGERTGGILVADGRKTRALPFLHDTRIWRLEISPDGRRLASLAQDLGFGLWDLGSASPFARIDRASLGESFGAFGLASMAFAGDGTRLLVRDGAGHDVFVAGVPVPETVPHVDAAGGLLAVSPDGRLVATAGYNEPTRIREAASGREIANIRGRAHWRFRQQLSFSADARRFAALSADGTEVFAIDTPAPPRLLMSIPVRAPPVALSPDGRSVITAGGASPDVDRRPDNLSGERGAGAYDSHDDPDQLSTAAWNVDTGERLWSLPVASISAAFSRDGKKVYVTDDSGVTLVDVATGRVERTWPLHRGELYGLAISPREDSIAVAGDHGAWLLDARSGNVRELERPASAVWSLAFSPDGRWLAANGRSVPIYDTVTGELVIQIPGGGDPDHFVAFTPDGALLHAGAVLRRTEIRESGRATSPERSLEDVLQRYRLRLVGQRIVPEETQPAAR